MDIYYYLSEEWLGVSFDSSYHYAHLLMQMALENNDKEYELYSWQLYGNAFDYDYQFDSARFYYQKGLSQAIAYADSSKIASFNFNLGTLFILEGNYARVPPYFEIAIAYFEGKPEKERQLAQVYNNMGTVWRNIRKYPEAINIYQKSFELRKGLPLGKSDLSLHMNIGIAYLETKELEVALYHFRQARELALQLDDRYNYLFICNNLASAFLQIDHYDSAAFYLDQVLGQSDVIEPSLMIFAYGARGGIHARQNNWAAAAEMFGNAARFIDEEKIPQASLILYQQLAEYNERRGRFDLALESLKKANLLKEKMLNTEVLNTSIEWEERFRTQEKEKEIFALKLEQEERALEALRERNQRVFLWSAVLLSLLGTVFLYRLFILRGRASKALASEKSTIENALKEKELLMQEIHHRVKNNLQVITSLLNLQSNLIEDEVANAAVTDSKNRVFSMSLIHQSLYEMENLTEVRAKEYFTQLMNNLKSTFQGNERDIEVQLEIEDLTLDVDQAIPLGLIINEIVTNSFKHAFVEQNQGQITLRLRRTGDILHLYMADNGKGNQGKPLFRKRSLGMLLLKDLGKKLKAETNIQTEDGVKIDMQFPYKQ